MDPNKRSFEYGVMSSEESQEIEEDNEEATAEQPTLFDQDAPENA